MFGYQEIAAAPNKLQVGISVGCDGVPPEV